jgi:thymidylate synthase (FAD)
MMISATYLKHMGDDLDVVNAAKVSFAKESKEFNDNSDRLIKYLAKHRHMSPFGHCFARFHVKAPIFVARQLVTDVWRGRSADKKQGSEGVVNDVKIGDITLTAKVLYNSLIDRGVCPEQARMVLPQSTMTEWWWSGSLDAFADMCNLRCTGDTQLETRLVANDICDKMRELFPVSWLALRGL